MGPTCVKCRRDEYNGVVKLQQSQVMVAGPYVFLLGQIPID